MTKEVHADAAIDAIRALGMDIARACPDCADKATELVRLAGQLRAGAADRETVRDAIESETVGSDVTDAQISTTTEAVLKAVKNDGGV